MARKLTREEFITKCKDVHGDKYDYSLVEYVGGSRKINIICLEHGLFTQRASAHSDGQGCGMCNTMNRRCQLPELLNKAKLIHNDKYDYSLVKEYQNSNSKIPVICPEHGKFMITSHHHVNRGQGCGECKKMGLEVFLKKSHKKHGGVYDYSLIKTYNNNREKVPILCEKHGQFEVRVCDHIHGGQGCPSCSLDRIRKSLEKFIVDANEIHNNKYDYSLTEYINNKTKVKIICHNHGVFEQRPDSHLGSKQGCPLCKRMDLSDFINYSNNIHENKYDYSLVNYNTVRDKVTIICPEHNQFTQRVSAHKNGNGCPICRESKGEREIRIWLKKNKIKYIPQQTFSGCSMERLLRFDFYLPELNVCIEFQGEQHYKSVKLWGGDDDLKTRQKRDEIKMGYCKNNNIPLIIIKYNDNINLMLSTITTVM
jgi:hypothetical protein